MPHAPRPTRGSSALAVIPARGGSKRIPRKNIKDFCGKPMIGYSIEAALASGLFDEVVVSTDDAEIARIAQEFGAVVPFVRPPEAASDTATTAEVLLHALRWYEAEGKNWEYLYCLYPTAPFCGPDTLKKGYEILTTSGAPAVLTVAEFPYPIQRAVRKNQQGCLEWRYPEHELTRSQDLEPAYHDAGQLYGWPVKKFLANPRLMPEGAMPLVLDRTDVVDIDTPEDWAFAEQLFKAKNL